MEQRKLLYIDEAGFYLLVHLDRTWALKGQTPLLRSGCRYQHVSAMSAVSEAGELYYQIQEGNFTRVSVVAFLKSLSAFFNQKLFVIWDGATIHRDENVKRFLAEGQDEPIFLARIPPYCPELNADEQVWKALKVDRLKNVVCKNTSELKTKLQQALDDLQNQTIANFFKHPKLQFYKS